MKDLFTIISEIKNTTDAHITYVADCGFPKKSGLGNVSKRVEIDCQLNYNYVEEVRKRIAAKGGDPSTFTEEGLRWGHWELANKVIAHNGERYLRYYCTDDVPEVEYFVDGVAATPQQVADIKAYLAAKDKGSAKQQACGLTKKEEVVPRNVKFSNILSLSVNGETYTKQNAAA